MYSFYECKKLEAITLPDSVTDLGVYAFDHCTALASVTLSKSLTEIGERTFNECVALKSLEVPVSVKKIEGAAFVHAGIEAFYYEGTAEQWDAVEKASTWNALSNFTEVICADETCSLGE